MTDYEVTIRWGYPDPSSHEPYYNGKVPCHDGNVDVVVTFSDGRRYIPTFFTIENVRRLMIKDRLTGESGGGLYFWCVDMIIVETLTDQIIYDTIAKLVEEGDLHLVANVYPPTES